MQHGIGEGVTCRNAQHSSCVPTLGIKENVLGSIFES